MFKAIILFPLIVIFSFATWSNPQLLEAPFDDYDPFGATISTSYTYMIFAGSGPDTMGMNDLYLSQRISGVWQTPVNLGNNVNSAKEQNGPYLTQNSTLLYFASGPDATQRDIYVATMNGMTPGPSSDLGSPVNTSYYETAPCLTTDGNTLYFSSNRPGGFGGHDIYYSTKSGSTWSQPLNLGNIVNSANNDLPCWISNDGLTLVMKSDKPGGLGSFDLYITTKTGGVWGIPVSMGTPINSPDQEEDITFVCNDGVIGGMAYISRSVGSMGIYTSVDSNYINVSPASVGELKVLYR